MSARRDSGFTDDGNVTETETIQDYEENWIQRYKRTYNSWGIFPYLLPIDDDALLAEWHLHYLFLTASHGRLYNARFESPPFKVLDVGTGTGQWSVNFADLHPQSHVIGIDLSAIQPLDVPPNLEFQVDDAERYPWTWTSPFDYIFVRQMNGSIHDWERFLGECFCKLAPGGAIEIQFIDFDLRVTEQFRHTHLWPTFHQLLKVGFRRLGRMFSIHNELWNWLRAAGFADVDYSCVSVNLEDEDDFRAVYHNIEGLLLRCCIEGLEWRERPTRSHAKRVKRGLVSDFHRGNLTIERYCFVARRPRVERSRRPDLADPSQ